MDICIINNNFMDFRNSGTQNVINEDLDMSTVVVDEVPKNGRNEVDVKVFFQVISCIFEGEITATVQKNVLKDAEVAQETIFPDSIVP